MAALHQPAAGPFGNSGLANFTLQRELGSGGMGHVCLVTSNVTGYRFAVKICNFAERALREAFMQELLLWLDLPRHPYLAPCYFFRSLGEGVAIFSEYFESGSLADWIADGRFGGVKELLDIALLTARGLAFLHELGYVHRDFKPRNVLMDTNGTPRIADFGLAVPGLLVKNSPLNVPGGMTAAYRSPEQAACAPLGPATDMWSWAVSVIELFVGQVTWLDGQVAGKVFERYLKDMGDIGGLAMPKPLVKTLRRCFQDDPERRWRSMEEVVKALKPAYDGLSAVAPVTLVGEEPSPSPPLDHVESSRAGIGWFSPDYWNNFLYRRGAKIASPNRLYLPIGSRNGRALADLIAYAEIEGDLRRLAENDRDLRGSLAAFYGNKGNIHLALGDATRATELFDRAIVICRELLARGDPQAADLLLAVYSTKAPALHRLGDIPAMGRMFDEADTERLADLHIKFDGFVLFQLQKANYLSRSGRMMEAHEITDCVISSLEANDLEDWSVRRLLATALASKAEISNQWGQNTEALDLLHHAIEVCESHKSYPETSRNDRKTIVNDSAQLRTIRATILIAIGRADEGIPEIRRALKDLAWLIDSGETQHSSQWTGALLTLANAYSSKNQFTDAAAVYEQAIHHMENLIATQGREELELTLAKTCVNKFSLFTRQQDYRSQIALLDRGIQLMERWRNRVSSRELSYDLARAYDNRALAYMADREYKEALRMCDKVVDIYDRLTAQGDSSDLQGDIAWAHVNRAYVLFFLQHVAECLRELHKSMPMLISEERRTGRKDFGELIERVRKLFGDRDW